MTDGDGTGVFDLLQGSSEFGCHFCVGSGDVDLLFVVGRSTMLLMIKDGKDYIAGFSQSLYSHCPPVDWDHRASMWMLFGLFYITPLEVVARYCSQDA